MTLNWAHTDPLRQRCIRALSHPLTLTAVILLLVNDHILRVTWPSWITGKLGDFAWLAFFPLTLAAPLAWIIPARFASRRVIIPALSFGVTAALFISMKTLPAALDAGLWLLSQITGGPFTLRLDPTDLITLPGLAVALWVWKRAETPVPASRGWVVLALGALATIATTPPPPAPVVNCLVQTNEGDLYAIVTVTQDVYTSQDGGLTWKLHEQLWDMSGELFNQRYPCKRTEYWPLEEIVVKVPENTQMLIRVTRDKAERSTDAGKTWTQELDLSRTEAQLQYFSQHNAATGFGFGPYDWLIDKQTSNIIVAYGIEGILVRTPNGVWTRVAVGDFKPMEKINTLDRVIDLLGSHIVMAAALFVLMTATIKDWLRFQHWLLIPLYLMAWLSWGLIVLVTLIDNYYSAFIIYLAPILLVLLIIILIHGATTKRAGRQPSHVKWWAGFAASLLFLLPYTFWSQGVIPTYVTASAFALALVAAVLIAALLSTHVDTPPPESGA